MKRVKGEEKVMGPMFPRLHVNDTEKGGPRAPPRNKMALYEQLSVPAQRFNSGVLPLKPKSTANLAPLSSSQGNGHEGGVYSLVRRPPSRHPADQSHGRSSDPNTPLLQVESERRTAEDEFRVSTFVSSELGQGYGILFRNLETEKLSPSSPNLSRRPSKELKEITGLSMKRTDEENRNHIPVSREHKTTSAFMDNLSEGRLVRTDVTLCHSPEDEPSNNTGILCNTDNFRRPGCRFDPQVGGTIVLEPVMGVDDGDSAPRKKFASEKQIIANNLINDAEYVKDKTCKSLQTGNVDRCDDLSEISILETISGTDICPDAIVGIIGQEQFWEARRSIVKQQRLFAVQVFELHRLIKVQRLISGSPNAMLEDSAYLGQSLKSGKRLPLEYITRAPQVVSKPKNDSEKPILNMEYSAENTVGKTSLSSVQNGSHPSSYRPFPGNPPPAPVTNDSNMGPWCFQPPSGREWLIPVMSPSEGLVYKPYPAPSFTSPVYGGYGPTESTPTMGSYFPQSYGVPASHHHYQGMGVPFVPPTGHDHGYFPPYGMTVMNPVVSLSHPKAKKVSSEKTETAPEVFRFQTSKDNEIQASTASSPIERRHGAAAGISTERRNALDLFPTPPTIDNTDSSPNPKSCVPNNAAARVIKVVPHNARSANESAARIFQSIQEERKQYDFGFAHL